MVSRYKMLDAGYGVLNPSFDSQHKKSYDTDEVSFFSTMMKTAKDTLGTQDLANPGPMVGIVLRVEGYTNQGAAMDPTSWHATTNSIIHGDIASDGPALVQIRVRVPEIHACLPIPQDLPNDSTSSPDHDIINQYPLFTAQTAEVSVPSRGQLVWVDFQNKETMNGGIYIDIVDSRTPQLPARETILSTEAFKKEETVPPEETAPGGEEEVEEGDGSEYTGTAPPPGYAKNFITKISERLANKDRVIPEGKIIGGTDYTEVTKAAQEELDFWNGKHEGNGKYKPGRPEYDRIAEYWKNVNANPAKKYKNDAPWSAAFISYIFRDLEFSGRQSHYFYIGANGDTKGKTSASSPWKAYSLLGDQPGKIVANIGDILVKPRFPKNNKKQPAASHGDVVYKIEGDRALLAGGNLGPSGKATGKIAAELRLNLADGTYASVKGSDGKEDYEVILKYKALPKSEAVA